MYDNDDDVYITQSYRFMKCARCALEIALRSTSQQQGSLFSVRVDEENHRVRSAYGIFCLGRDFLILQLTLRFSQRVMGDRAAFLNLKASSNISVTEVFASADGASAP